MVVDGEGTQGPSPMQSVAIGFAGCMSIDVVSILEKGRHPLKSVRVKVQATRATTAPRRFTGFHLAFHIAGAVPPHAVERAIQLSRDTYCSVWHSLRTDIELTTTFEIEP